MNGLDFQCPVCGAEVHPNAHGCKSCGARREAHGWSRPESHEGLGLPEDDDFDYREFVDREFEGSPAGGLREVPPMKIFWWIAAVVTLIAFVFVFVL